MVRTIDIERLKASAIESCCRESYLVLIKNPLVRVGAGAKADVRNDILLSIDISIDLCPGSSHIDTDTLEKGLALAKELRGMGHELECQEGVVSCEINVNEEDMNQIFEYIQGILERLEII